MLSSKSGCSVAQLATTPGNVVPIADLERQVEADTVAIARAELVESIGKQIAVATALAEQRQNEVYDLTFLLEAQRLELEEVRLQLVSTEENLRIELNALYESTSWKITAPIRKLKDFLIKFKR